MWNGDFGKTLGEQMWEDIINGAIWQARLRFCWGIIKLIMVVLLIMALGKYLFFTSSAHARYKIEYDNMPAETQEWYRTRKLTPEASRRLGYQSCCEDADVVDTQFRVDTVDGHDTWFYKDNYGDWKKVPEDIIHWDEPAPGGQPVLFKHAGSEVCFFPPQGAI